MAISGNGGGQHEAVNSNGGARDAVQSKFGTLNAAGGIGGVWTGALSHVNIGANYAG